MMRAPIVARTVRVAALARAAASSALLALACCAAGAPPAVDAGAPGSAAAVAAGASSAGASSAGASPAGAAAAAGAAAPAPVARGQLDPRWNDYVKVAPATARDLPRVLEVTGRIALDEDHTQVVAAPINGRVASLRVRLGDRVRVGQELLTLTSADAAHMHAAARMAHQDLALAEQAYQRVAHLMPDGAVSAKDAAQAAADRQKAQAEVERHEAGLRAMGVRTDAAGVRVALTARLAGTVVARHVAPGQEVRAESGEPLLTVSDLDTLWVLADVYEQDLARVAVGAPATVRVAAYPSASFSGTVAYVGDTLSPQSRTVPVRVVVVNPQRQLKPEMFARVAIAQPDSGRAIFVPTRALVCEGDATYVLTVSGGAYARREVQLGEAVRGMRRVHDGLREGEQIVTEGAIFADRALRD